MPFESVSTTRAYEDIVTQIEQSIAAGEFQVGDQLPGERELAVEFGVSRVVIREAMRNLEARRIVEVRRGSGTYIRNVPSRIVSRPLTLLLKLEEASLLDLYVVRQALELVSVSRAAQYATPEELARLQECLIEQRALIKKEIHTVEEFRAFSAKDEEFHLLMAEASQNQPLVTLLSTVLPLVMSGRLEIIERSGGFETFIQRSARESVCDEHASILDAINNRDTRAAEYFVYAHLQRSMATYRDLQ